MEVEAVALEADGPTGAGLEIVQSGEAASEARRGPKSCSSHFKGVTKHRRTGRWVLAPVACSQRLLNCQIPNKLPKLIWDGVRGWLR